MGWAGIHAIEYDVVEVGIQVQSGTKSLDRAHCSALAARHTEMDAGASPLVGKE
jgi:hypothetical protein